MSWTSRTSGLSPPRPISRGIARSAPSSGAPSGRSSSAGSSTPSTSTSSSFIIIDIQQSFTVERGLAGLLATVTLVMRLVGGAVAGTAADKWGRKLPMMLSMLWFSLFAFLSGFSTSYAMLFALRALFGLGMGGEWAAGMPLVHRALAGETARARVGPAARRVVLGLSARGRGLPVHLSALQRHAGHRLARHVLDRDHSGASSRCGSARKVPESPVWLERQRHLNDERAGKLEAKMSLVRIFQRDLIGTTIQTTLVIGAFMCIYYSIALLVSDVPARQRPRNAAVPGRVQPRRDRRHRLLGPAVGGRARPPRRGHDHARCSAWPRFRSTSTPARPIRSSIGALTMGMFGSGIWGMAPA